MSRAALALLGLFALGCAASETCRPYAFVPGPRHHRVRYLEGEEDARRILPAGWRVRDHRVDGDGRPTAPFDERRDRVPIALDLDEDRRIDLRGVAPRYDARYEHDETGAEIVGITLPVDAATGRRSLAMIAHGLIDGVFGEGFVDLRGDRARAYETRIVDEYEAEVGGAPAHLVTIELAQSLPARGVAWGRGTILTIVLIRRRSAGAQAPARAATGRRCWCCGCSRRGRSGMRCIGGRSMGCSIGWTFGGNETDLGALRAGAR